MSCRECFKNPKHPDKNCCFNCYYDSRICDVLHECGSDCHSWMPKLHVTLSIPEYKDFSEINKHVSDIMSVLSALEKQIPKKTTKRQYVPNGTLIYGHCPNCDWFTENFFKYCRNCGQALDWSDTE